ncbi:MAG: M23 family metallopeptidase [Alphaproteobacteria bacterium]|nr:M23 family metallopeptidase [Alphaproteobacteria bacterium]
MKNLLNKTVCGAVLAATLSACTFYNPPAPYLPSRNGIEAGETITVQGNENIYAIAREHNVSMRELIVLNDLQPPFDVKPGQSLTLPATGTGFSTNSMPAPTPAPLGTVEQSNLAPIEPAAVSAQPLEPAPVATAPANTGATAAPVPLTGDQSSVTPQPLATQNGSQTQPVQALNQPTPPPQQVATTAAPAAAASVATTDTPAMVWPVQGPIISGFGAKGPGLTNDGVDIGAPLGAPVAAAAAGTVVYAGDEMKGFGNLVLIRHQDNWVTAYAHLGRVLVHKDSIVAQGDMIGTVGKTGNVSTPELHFETRHDGKVVDPATVIQG